MVITRTPLRISFFGGGTDYPLWFRENGGAVLSTSIDKYVHVSCRYLPQFFEHKSRIAYSKVELVKSRSEIEHRMVRGILDFLNINDGVEIHNFDDLPARSGMGSSSSFTVGLLHALQGLRGEEIQKRELALNAIHVEQEILKEHVGCQDQAIVAFGGLNKIVFSGEQTFDIKPIKISSALLRQLQGHLLLFFTGRQRRASEIAEEQVKNTPQKGAELKAIHAMVNEAEKILGGASLADFGKLLHESWLLKRTLSNKISDSDIDGIYEAGRGAGATGGKLLGAGGGGFMLFFAPPEKHEHIKQKLAHILHIPFSFEESGTQIIYKQHEQSKFA